MTSPTTIPFLALALMLLASRMNAREIYEVGPPAQRKSLAEVPWDELRPGDEVRIHWREEPYREKWSIGAVGTKEAPILVRGVPGPQKQRPVIDGDEAVTVRGQETPVESRTLLRIGAASKSPDRRPAWIVIEGLELRNAYEAYSFQDARGRRQAFAGNAAGLYIDSAENITIRDCVIQGHGNGFFVASRPWEPSKEILFQRNFVFNNGTPGSIYRHNVYTEALGMVFEGNYLGKLRLGARGNNLKDRSSRLVVRNNWIEGGNKQLDLTESEMPSIQADPGYHNTLVERNVLIEFEYDGNRQMIYFGGDGEDWQVYKNGPLRIINNTFLTHRLDHTVVVGFAGRNECLFSGNIVHASSPRAELALLEGKGRMKSETNWVRRGFNAEIHYRDSLQLMGTRPIEGVTPGFVDEAKGDLRLKPGSTARVKGKPLGAVGDDEPFPARPLQQAK